VPHFVPGGPTKVGDMLADAERAAEVFSPTCNVRVGKGKYSLKYLGTEELGRILRDVVA
jgi:hypothetical protein